MKIAIYEGVDLGVRYLAAEDVDFAASQIPKGVEFWMVDSSMLPESRQYRDSWRIDRVSLGEKSGTGVQ